MRQLLVLAGVQTFHVDVTWLVAKLKALPTTNLLGKILQNNYFIRIACHSPRFIRPCPGEGPFLTNWT
jgi:hypothetical protein